MSVESAFEDSDLDNKELIDIDDPYQLKQTTQSLGISRRYVQDWTTPKAFRELYQNWRDGILESFKLDQASFRTKVEKDANEIRILAYSSIKDIFPVKGELLGYIRFKIRKGSVEFVNFQAELHRSHLEIGNSTKSKSTIAAGIHGEGLKLSALVFRRENYGIRLISNNYNWIFEFRNTTLCCRFRKITERQARSFGAASENMKFDPGKDVCVIIDKAKNSQNGPGKKVSEVDFETWMNDILDIHGPENPKDIVSTRNGDLILDEKFAGRMYLKGLLLPSGGSGTIPLKAGYNILRGKTSRDRQRLSNDKDEAYMLTSIWEEAIERASDICLDTYIGLLRDDNEYADVKGAEIYLSRATASTIWKRLKSEGSTRFYYHQEGDQPNFEIITKDLKQQPEHLSRKLWRCLRKYGLVRTPYEQCLYVFQTSSPSMKPATVFSTNIQRGLKAAFALDTKTQNIEVQYVNSAEIEIDMYFFKHENLLKVNDKWLDFTTVHNMTPCRLTVIGSGQEQGSNFLCGHVIEEIYVLAINQILPNGEASKFARFMRIKVQEMLQQMPQDISVRRSDGPSELVVTWSNDESELVREALSSASLFCVTLHRESTCSRKRNEYLHTAHRKCKQNSKVIKIESDRPEPDDERCECHKLVIPITSQPAVFSHLDPEEQYFPMIARAGENSIYGIPPKAMQPATRRPEASRVKAASMFSTSFDMDYQCALLQDGICDGIMFDSSEQEQEQEQEWKQELEWSKWEKETLPKSFDQFFSSRDLGPFDLSCFERTPSLEFGAHRFKVKDYAQVRLSPKTYTEEASECVVYVHRILYDKAKDDENRLSLLVTRYSFLGLFPPFSTEQQLSDSISRKELLLHFNDFETMGHSRDAEIIPISRILESRKLDFEPAPYAKPVQLVTHVPEDLDASGFFCRFALRGRVGDEPACITPVEELGKFPQYTQSMPVVIDLSPSVLGLAEGFFLGGYEVAAAVGFSTISDMTWKARYPSATIYDAERNDINSVLTQIENGQLPRPDWLTPGTPKVAVIGSKTRRFKGSQSSQGSLDSAEFLQPLKTMQDVMNLPNPGANFFDFLVCTMPAAVLHSENLPIFGLTIHILLEKRFSVNIQTINCSSYGVPVDNTFVVISASPICARFGWQSNQSGPLERTLGDIIGDLAFENPRVPVTGQSLQCKNPSTENETVFNHNTGRFSGGASKVEMTATSLRMPSFGMPIFQHPTRNDALTIRELARIHEFPDDFVLYDGPNGSYHYFKCAIPPQIMTPVAQGIREIIKQCRVLETDETSVSVKDERKSKRARLS